MGWGSSARQAGFKDSLRFWGKQPSKEPLSCPSLGSFQSGALFMKGRGGGGEGEGSRGPAVMETNSAAGPAAVRSPAPPSAWVPSVGAPARLGRGTRLWGCTQGPGRAAGARGAGREGGRGKREGAQMDGPAHLFLLFGHIHHRSVCPGSFSPRPLPCDLPWAPGQQQCLSSDGSGCPFVACCFFSVPAPRKSFSEYFPLSRLPGTCLASYLPAYLVPGHLSWILDQSSQLPLCLLSLNLSPSINLYVSTHLLLQPLPIHHAAPLSIIYLHMYHSCSQPSIIHHLACRLFDVLHSAMGVNAAGPALPSSREQRHQRDVEGTERPLGSGYESSGLRV